MISVTPTPATYIFGIIFIVGSIAGVIFYIQCILGLVLPSEMRSSSRKSAVFRYGSLAIISWLISIFCIIEANTHTYNSQSPWTSFSAFLNVIQYLALAGVFIGLIGLLLGIIWPPLIGRKARKEVAWHWGIATLALVVLGLLFLLGNQNAGWPWFGNQSPPCSPITYDGKTTCMPVPVADEPIIYLYPSHQEQVSVRLDYGDTLTNTYPVYDPIIHGWNVTAYPDGHLINNADGREYNYIFWEGLDDQTYDLSTGFIVKGSDTASFLQNQLASMGLTPKEYNDMIVYWLPKMENNPYNLIHFAGKDYTDFAKLTITPKPDSLLRIFMVWKPLQASEQIQPQTFPTFERNGFTVVEWGGVEVQ